MKISQKNGKLADGIDFKSITPNKTASNLIDIGCHCMYFNFTAPPELKLFQLPVGKRIRRVRFRSIAAP
jgi:hypothetical protein